MGHVQDRWYKKVKDPGTGKVQRAKTSLHGKGMRYKVRYLDPDGVERSKMYPDKCKKQADDFLHEIENAKRSGDYLDPQAGKITLQSYGEDWFRGMAFEGDTRNSVESRLKSLIYPRLGSVELGTLLPKHIRDWLVWLQGKGIANSTKAVCFVHLSALLDAAVDDKRISENPCRAKSVPRPQPDKRKIVPWRPEKVQAVQVNMPERYRLGVTLGAGAGLRQGEIFGVSDVDIDREQSVLHVVRQVTLVDNVPVFSPPKGGKERSVPLATELEREIDAHMDAYPPQEITLPWREPNGEPHTARLVLVNDRLEAINRTAFNRTVWRPAVRTAGMGSTKRRDGMHALRHFFASTLLDAGESIKALAEWLGHTDPAFTMRVYTHLLPSSNERTRRAIDMALMGIRSSNGPETASAA